jgi:hypothetical protein
LIHTKPHRQALISNPNNSGSPERAEIANLSVIPALIEPVARETRWGRGEAS